MYHNNSKQAHFGKATFSFSHSYLPFPKTQPVAAGCPTWSSVHCHSTAGEETWVTDTDKQDLTRVSDKVTMLCVRASVAKQVFGELKDTFINFYKNLCQILFYHMTKQKITYFNMKLSIMKKARLMTSSYILCVLYEETPHWKQAILHNKKVFFEKSVRES